MRQSGRSSSRALAGGILAAALVFAGVVAAQGPARSKAGGPETGQEHPLDKVMEFAADSRAALKDVSDYTAVFTKHELVGRKMIKQVIEMKLREKPFSVYFRYLSRPEAGREVIYVDGRNNGNLLVHEVGIKAIAGTVPIKPTDRQAMVENRYPITNVGMSRLLETAYSIWETERHADPEQVEVKFFGNAKLGDVECEAVQITHKREQRDLKFHLSRVYFDKKTRLPIRAERYGWPRRPGEKPPLVEEYTYSNVKTNVGLTDADFDVNNPRYGF